MQFVMKVSSARSAVDAAAFVTDLLRQLLPPQAVRRASVEPVFPDATSGRRAGMLVLSLDDDISAALAERVLHALRSSEAVAYVQPAEPRRPI